LLDLAEEDAMDTIPQWRLVGDWFDLCSCDIPCPCEFAQPPTNNQCNGVLAWHVREGQYGDVPLAGLTLVAVGSFEGNIWTGESRNMSMGFYIDERADDRQRDALQVIFGGEAGGWPAGFAALIQEVRGIEFAPIQFELDGDLASWRVEVPGKVDARAEALTGPTTPPGKRVQTINPPGSEVGPGGPATWAQAITHRVDGFGFTWQWDGKSSKHIPFDWSGPEPA
jgi:hypothetical protein